MGLRERAERWRRLTESIRTLNAGKLDDPDDIHPDTGLPHEEHVGYLRTCRYDDVLAQRRELPEIDAQIRTLYRIWGAGSPPIHAASPSGRSRSKLVSFRAEDPNGRLLFLLQEAEACDRRYVLSLSALALIRLSRQRAWRDTLRDGLGLTVAEMPKSRELKQFRETILNHRSAWHEDEDRYLRAFSMAVPSARTAIERLADAYAGLVAAVRGEVADLATVSQKARSRLARAVFLSRPGIPARNVARAFGVSRRAVQRG
jgi:hypothetical protein